MERIWISGDLGVAKPETGIFTAAQEKLGLAPEELCFVGDSYGHDMTGAKNAGWTAVWFNHRGHQATGEVRPDYEVHSERELIALLKKISIH